jgi:hypothetical protein
MLLLGLGLGNVMQVLVLAVQNSVHPKEVGVATSGSTFFRSIGGTFGTAIFSGVFTSSLTSHLMDSIPGATNGGVDIEAMTGSVAALASLPEELRVLALQAFTDALDHVFLTAVPIMALGFVAALFLKEIKLRSSDHAPTVSE